MREAIDNIEVQMLQVAADMADLQYMKRARDGSGGEARPRSGPTVGSREQPDHEPSEVRRGGAPEKEKAKELIQEAKRLLDGQPDYQKAWQKLNEALGLLR